MAGFEIFTNDSEEVIESLPIFKEYAVNFDTGEAILSGGDLVILTENEAIKVWIWKALKTERERYKAYSSSFGSSLVDHVGEVYSTNITNTLMEVEIKECLGVNPYITQVYDFEFTNNGTWREPVINFKIDTVYSDEEVVTWKI